MARSPLTPLPFGQAAGQPDQPGPVPEVMQDRSADVGSGIALKRDARFRVVALGSSQQAHQSHLHQVIYRFGAELGIVEGNRSDQQPVVEQQLIAPLVAAQRQ